MYVCIFDKIMNISSFKQMKSFVGTVLSLASYSSAHATTADEGFFRSRIHPVVAQLTGLTCATAGAEVLGRLDPPEQLFHWVLGQFQRGQQRHLYVPAPPQQPRWCGVGVTQSEPRGGPTPIGPKRTPLGGPEPPTFRLTAE